MCDIIRIVILTAAITLALTVGAVACNKPFDNAPQSSAGEFIPDSLTVFDKGIIINHNKNRANLH